MSATEVIEQIKALPAKEQAQVLEFTNQLQAKASARQIRFASSKQANAAGDKVVQQHEDVFRKLAH